jgi:hypothetical protein
MASSITSVFSLNLSAIKSDYDFNRSNLLPQISKENYRMSKKKENKQVEAAGGTCEIV